MAPATLADQTIHPYTDLLLHDMGEALADGRPDFEASGTEWRTPPLWGLGLIEEINGRRFLLHDGRARTLEEAILWHGGEAEPAARGIPNRRRRDAPAAAHLPGGAVRRCVAVVAAAAVVALPACGGGGPSRSEVVEPIVSTEVPARFEAFAGTATDVSTAVTAWCVQGAPAPSAEIATALEEWYALKPFWFGPVMDRRAQFLVNFRVDPEGIDELLASDEAVDPDSLRTLVGADQRGLGALALLVTGEPDERRCEYAQGIADLVAEEARSGCRRLGRVRACTHHRRHHRQRRHPRHRQQRRLRVARGGDGPRP